MVRHRPSPIGPNDRAVLRKAGAEARASGVSFMENPFLRHEALPGNSGERFEHWKDKHDAWDMGWKAEDASGDR
jgi:hypothetical protein